MPKVDPEREALQRRLLDLLSDPAAPDEAIEDAYLRLVAPKAWAEGWRGFREYGRGALIFDLRGRGWRQPGAIESYYAPEAMLFEPGGPRDPAIEVAVGVYQPEDEVVCLVLYDAGPSCSRLRRTVAPPMA
jgi:hypothetical protein